MTTIAFAWPPIRGDVLAEVLDDDLGLLGQVVRVQARRTGDRAPGLGRFSYLGSSATAFRMRQYDVVGRVVASTSRMNPSSIAWRIE